MSLLPSTTGQPPTGGAPTEPQIRPLREGLLPYTRRHRGMVRRGLAFSCLLVGARLALPLPLTQVVASSTTPGADPGPTGPIALLSAAFVGLALVAGVAEHFQRLAFAHFAGRSISDARAAALSRVPGDGDEASVHLTAQVIGDCMRVKQGLKGFLNHITVNGLLVIGICVVLAFTDLIVGLVTIAGAAVLGVVAVTGARRVGVVAAKHRQREVALAGSVHVLVAEAQADDQSKALSALQEIDSESGDADIAMTRWEGLTTWVAHTVLVTTAAAALLLGVHSVQAGRMSAGTLFAVMAYLLMLQGPAIRCARQIARTALLLVSARELAAVLVGPHGSRRTDPAGRTHRGLRSASAPPPAPDPAQTPRRALASSSLGPGGVRPKHRRDPSFEPGDGRRATSRPA